MDAFGYHIQAEFEIFFNEEKTDRANCVALEPPEKVLASQPFQFWCFDSQLETPPDGLEYHLAPEIFVSEGSPGSIVAEWVRKRDGIGGIHHLAYQVDSVEGKMREWTEKGWGDFTSSKPFNCDELTQVFSKSHQLTGVVYEFIERRGRGFCEANVKDLMNSTIGKIGLDKNIP